MQLDVLYVFDVWFWILAALIAMFVMKIAVITVLSQIMGERKQDAVAAGIMLWQMGEFGFVLIALATQHKILLYEHASFLIALAVMSMALTPYLIERTPWILARFGYLKNTQNYYQQRYNRDILK